MLAIILARRDKGENDQMVTCYTREQGKVEVLAKGIKKIISKNSANLGILSLVEIEIVPGKEIDRLTKVQPIKTFANIYADLDKIFLAGYVVKIIDANTLAHERDEKIFNLLASFLEFLNSAATINSLNLATGFMVKFWHCLGFGLPDEDSFKSWLTGDWPTISSVVIPKNEQIKIFEVVRKFVIQHSGKDLPSLAVDKVFA